MSQEEARRERAAERRWNTALGTILAVIVIAAVITIII